MCIKALKLFVIIFILFGVNNDGNSQVYQAYQDYKVRKIMSDKITSISNERLLIAETYMITGAYPVDDSFSKKFLKKKEFAYNPKNGQITIFISEKDPKGMSGLIGKNITYTPSYNGNGWLNWTCETTLKKTQAPYPCY
jgi:hypothetical protein